MYNTTAYLQEYYRRNKTQIDAEWQAWAAQNPQEAARYSTPQRDDTFAGTGGPTYRPPDQFNWPGGDAPVYGNQGGNPLDPYRDPYNVAGGNPGGSTSGDPFGTPGSQSGGNDWWKQLVLYGIPVIQQYLQGRQQAGQAKNLQDAQRKQRELTLALASPERYMKNYTEYLKGYRESYRPWLVTEADRAAIGEQTAMQGFDTDVARRGLSGSGLALSGRSAIRTGRQAQINENLRRYSMSTDEAAREAAGQTRTAEINASLGAPYTYVPRPNPYIQATQGLSDAYRDWLWLQGTQKPKQEPLQFRSM